ncbi:hypothetical protein Bbelb_343810 [Branchiostoma belcheri]|nr:hypothetical protein Bbelb_343810 [Branchiostoma belcheri]
MEDSGLKLMERALNQHYKNPREENGDIDIRDGKLASPRQEYTERIDLANNIESHQDKHWKMTSQLNLYSKKIEVPTTPEEKLKELNWDIVETSNLLDQAQQFSTSYNNLMTNLHPSDSNPAAVITEHKRNRPRMLSYITNLFKKKRQPAATRVLVVLLSGEQRKTKPYALPVQYIPYHSLRDQYVRDLTRGPTLVCWQLVPLFFALMSRRKKADYIAVLTHLKERLPTHNVVECVVDFEEGMWRALPVVFPGINIKGCAFHRTKVIWKHAQQLGLQVAYCEDEKIHRWVRRLLALPFIPAEAITPALEALEETARGALTELVGYVRSTWIESSVWSPRRWSVYRQSVRTNNDVEGWHTRLNLKAKKSALPLYLLIDLLHGEGRLVRVQACQVCEGQLRRYQRATYKNLQGRLFEAWRKFEVGDKTAKDLLVTCASIYGPVITASPRRSLIEPTRVDSTGGPTSRLAASVPNNIMAKHPKRRKQIREQPLRQKVVRRTTDGKRNVICISDPRRSHRPGYAATGCSLSPEEVLTPPPPPQPLEQDAQSAPSLSREGQRTVLVAIVTHTGGSPVMVLRPPSCCLLHGINHVDRLSSYVISLGCERLLTSGCDSTVLEGLPTLKKTQETALGMLQIVWQDKGSKEKVFKLYHSEITFESRGVHMLSSQSENRKATRSKLLETSRVTRPLLH